MDGEAHASLPDWFCRFLETHGVSPMELMPVTPLPRYVRLKPCADAGERQRRIDAFRAELAAAVVPVPWMPDFLQLDGGTRIAACQAYKSGWVYGIDVSSGFAIRALDLMPDDQVLDMCCAPGSKLCYISDLIGNTGVGTVTGVDISDSRLAIARSIARKYGLDRIRLFCADGTNFRVYAPTRLGARVIEGSVQQVDPPAVVTAHDDHTTPHTVQKRSDYEDVNDNFDFNFTFDGIVCDDDDDDTGAPQRHQLHHYDMSNVSTVRPFHATRLLREDPQLPGPLYDKVIVDAECTTDGSIAHIENRSAWKGWDGLRNGWLASPEKLDGLEMLQRGLIMNAFSLLKPGGILVYSTCSLTCRQNEDVIAWFLRQSVGKQACLEPIPGADACPLAPSHASKYGDVSGIDHVVRFSPLASRTSGLFIARIRKLVQ